MARSGYLLEDLLVGGLELVGSHIAERAVQAGAVVPAEVLDGAPAGGGPGRPELLVQALALQRGEERLGERVVPALPGPPRPQGHLEIDAQPALVAAGVTH